MNDADKAECEAISAAIKCLERRNAHALELSKIRGGTGTDWAADKQTTVATDYAKALGHLHDELSARHERERFLRKKYGD